MTTTDQAYAQLTDFLQGLAEYGERLADFHEVPAELREDPIDFLTGDFTLMLSEPYDFQEQLDELVEQLEEDRRVEDLVREIEHESWFQEWLAACHSLEVRAAERKARAGVVSEQASAIVRLLGSWCIELSCRQEEALSRKSAKQILPLYALACTVERASEFARKARLNGRESGRAGSRQLGQSNRARETGLTAMARFSKNCADFRYHKETTEWIEETAWFREWNMRRQSPNVRAAIKRARAAAIDEQVEVIARLLERRSIKLSQRRKAALRRKAPVQLLRIYRLATYVECANEFAREARLDGRRPRRAN